MTSNHHTIPSAHRLVTPTPRSAAIALALTAGLLASACSDSPTAAIVGELASGAVASRTVHAAGNTFAVEVRGNGEATLLIHGGGEDAAMLAPLADQLATSGRRVITYDRRGTGESGRADWPGGGAAQHADDAAALLAALDVDDAHVIGFSSGGVIALDLAVRHPDVVAGAVVWEAPAIGVIPGGEQLNAEIMGPIDAHLAAHPGDFVGAQALLLSAILGFPVTVDDPLFAATRANAKPMIRDEPGITLRPFTADELTGASVTLAVGTAPNEVVAAATGALATMVGSAPVVVDTADHEAYLNDPVGFATVLADVA